MWYLSLNDSILKKKCSYNKFSALAHRTTFEKCATGRFLLCCYVKIYQLFLKLSGGIFQCWIAAIGGSVQVYMGARLMTHSIFYQLAFIALMIHLPSWWSGQKFEEIWEFILLPSNTCSIWAKRENLNIALWGLWKRCILQCIGLFREKRDL